MNRLPDQKIELDPSVASYLGNVGNDETFVSSYFTYVHPWIPLLSRRACMERIINPLASPEPQNTLFLAAMKLLAESPHASDTQPPIYHSIKTAFLLAESSGILSLRVFQVMILVTIYELGHAIYPAAYLTIGTCARYGTALGLNKMIEQFDTTSVDGSERELEEKRRSWWAVIVLDR